MKALRILAALPLLAVSLWAQSAALNNAMLPEGIFPGLDAILKKAAEQSPRMLNRALELEVAETNMIQARSGLLPTLSAGVSYYRSKDTAEYVYYTPGFESKNVYNVTKTPYSVTLSQPVFHWGQVVNSARIGAIQNSMAKRDYREAYRSLAQVIRTNYLRLIVQKLTVKRAVFYSEYCNNQLALDEARLTKKEISELQIARVRLQADQAQIAREQAEFDYEMAKASFARLSGTALLTDEQIPDSIPVLLHPGAIFDQLLAGFLSQKELPSSEAVSARKQLEIAKLSYASQKTRLRPMVNFSAGISQDQQNNLYGTIDSYVLTSIYGGFSVNWTIFDGLASRAATRGSLARRRQLEIDYKELTERLSQQAQIQAKHIGFLARNMAISDRALTDNQGGLKARQEEFARGTTSEADVRLTRVYVFDSEINAYNSRIQYLDRIADFLATIALDPVIANVAVK